MDTEREQLQKRFRELNDRALHKGRYAYSGFLSLAEQDALLSLRPAPEALAGLEGGYAMAERKLACFGSEALCGHAEEPPVCWVAIRPLSAKFAEALTHRDYLGALMGLGIKRETLGDIVPEDGAAYLFCLESVASFICGELTQVRRTAVRAERCDPPAIRLREPETTEENVASERLDAIVAAVYKLPRSRAAELFDKELVFIGGRAARSAAAVREGDIVSVRGYGRFVYCGIVKETRKGRLRVCVKIY